MAEVRKGTDTTYGEGQQIVSEPDSPTQLEKENPKDELPRKVGFVNPAAVGDSTVPPTDRVLDLDTGVVSSPELIEISGRKIDIDEFGEGGMFWLGEMYEQWLLAVETDQESTFSEEGEHGVDTSKVLEELRAHYPISYMKMVKTRTVPVLGKITVTRKEAYIKWDRNTTLEQWLTWTAATLRWRINYEIERRRISMALSAMDVSNAKLACENCLIAAEKFLALSERERLINI